LKTAVVVVAHGTVDDLTDLEAFLTAIRRGHPPPLSLLAEVRRRYEAVGGISPLGAICREVAENLEARLGVPVRSAMRLWKPYPKEVLAELFDEGIERVIALPLAQHSAQVYGDVVLEAARDLAAAGRASLRVTCAKNWGREPALTRAYAHEIREGLRKIPESERSSALILMTAHSLPVAVLRSGDPYEVEVRTSAAAIERELGPTAPSFEVAFQSQGMGGGEWLGPDLVKALDAARDAGKKHVLVAPIGFLADHVEILYDLDIEAQALAKERGLSLARTRSLNATGGLLDALENVARPLLDASRLQ
jgi:protoporphyrin/coproporphyrin ferrochelatase